MMKTAIRIELHENYVLTAARFSSHDCKYLECGTGDLSAPLFLLNCKTWEHMWKRFQIGTFVDKEPEEFYRYAELPGFEGFLKLDVTLDNAAQWKINNARYVPLGGGGKDFTDMFSVPALSRMILNNLFNKIAARDVNGITNIIKTLLKT